jgi:signal transduction histidine kinase
VARHAPSIAASRFARRAAIGFGLVTLITAVTAVGAAVFARREAARREKILEAYADDLSEAFQAQLAAEQMVAIGRGYLLVAEPRFLDRLNDAESQLDQALRALQRPGLSAREIELVTSVRTSAEHYRSIFDQIPVAASADARAQRVSILREELIPRRVDLGRRLEQLVQHRRGIQLDARREADRMAARTFALALALSAIAVAFSVLLAWRFIQHLASIYRRAEAAAEDARRSSSAREELLGVVAHDLRNPLNAISLQAVSIARHSTDPRTEERAAAIRRLTGRMDALIGMLLEAARVEAGRLSLSWRRCEVSDLLAAVDETFGGTARAQSIRLQLDPSPRGLGCWGDPERIAQVLSNLIGNALKFTRPGGMVRIGAAASGFHVRFEVRDAGPGIAPEHLPRVFDRFWRADDSGRKGTGLGLFIAKGIVDAHRGRIWVESEVGAGSAFIFELPVAPPAAQDDPLSTAPGAHVPGSAGAAACADATGPASR